VLRLPPGPRGARVEARCRPSGGLGTYLRVGTSVTEEVVLRILAGCLIGLSVVGLFVMGIAAGYKRGKADADVEHSKEREG